MSETKTNECAWPMLPMWDLSDWDWDELDGKARGKAKDFRSDFQSFWEAGIDWQKEAIGNSKKQYDEFFANMQGAKDSFAAFLPDKELPFMPEDFSTPKKFRKQMKEWEKMVNDHFKSVADGLADFAIKSQEKACSNLPEVPEKADKKKSSKKGASKKEPAEVETKASAKKDPVEAEVEADDKKEPAKAAK